VAGVGFANSFLRAEAGLLFDQEIRSAVEGLSEFVVDGDAAVTLQGFAAP
jgi:hypothetical protein